MNTYTLIAHLTERIVMTDVRAEVVAAYLSNRVNPAIYTVLASTGFSLNGRAWLDTLNGVEPAAA